MVGEENRVFCWHALVLCARWYGKKQRMQLVNGVLMKEDQEGRDDVEQEAKYKKNVPGRDSVIT